MRRFGRRRMVTGALGGAALGFAGAGRLQAALATSRKPPAKKSIADRVTLGRTGIEVSRLAMGTGTHGVAGSSMQARLGVGGLATLLEQAFDRGVTFFETADQYGTHPHVGEAAKRIGKNRVAVLTKTHARTADEAWADLQRFCRELGRDHIDIVLLHCMTSPNWTKEREGAMEALSRAKEKGMIRAHGVSCHSLEALRLAAKTPWVEVDLARINPAQAHMDADPETVLSVLREMKAAGKGILGMKIFGAGKLATQVDRALGYAAKLDVLDAFTIGFGSGGELDEVARKLPGLSLG